MLFSQSEIRKMIFTGEKTPSLFKIHPATISRLLARYSAIAQASLPGAPIASFMYCSKQDSGERARRECPDQIVGSSLNEPLPSRNRRI